MDAMTHEQLKAGRLKAALTQVQAAVRLGVSQPYLSQLEKGERPITAELARSATTLFRLSATALPIPESVARRVPANPDTLARQIAGLGYPGLAHLRHAKANPAAVLLEALVQEDLEVRLSEALPWVVLTYPDMDWPWLIREVKLRDAQNRLGFVVAMAQDLAATRPRFRPALERHLLRRKRTRARASRAGRHALPGIHAAGGTRLAGDDPLCACVPLESVTGLTADHLSHVS